MLYFQMEGIACTYFYKAVSERFHILRGTLKSKVFLQNSKDFLPKRILSNNLIYKYLFLSLLLVKLSFLKCFKSPDSAFSGVDKERFFQGEALRTEQAMHFGLYLL